MVKMSLFSPIGIATIGALCLLQAQPTASQEKRGVIPQARAFAEEGTARYSKPGSRG